MKRAFICSCEQYGCWRRPVQAVAGMVELLPYAPEENVNLVRNVTHQPTQTQAHAFFLLIIIYHLSRL